MYGSTFEPLQTQKFSNKYSELFGWNDKPREYNILLVILLLGKRFGTLT